MITVCNVRGGGDGGIGGIALGTIGELPGGIVVHMQVMMMMVVGGVIMVPAI